MDEMGTVEDLRAALAAARAALTALPGLVGRVRGPDLGPFFREVDDTSRLLEAARVAVLDEAIGRGETPSRLGSCRSGWVLEWAPSMAAGGAGRLNAVVTAIRSERTAQLRAALLEGRVGVANAADVLSEMERLEPRLVPEAVPTVWDALIQLAEAGGPQDIRRLRPRLLVDYGRPTDLQELQERATRHVMLSRPTCDAAIGDGVGEYVMRLDTEGMAVLEAALDPLSAPRPVEGSPDLRPSQQRRGDALIELVRRAVASADGVPVTTRAQLFVTMALEDLQREAGGGATVGGSHAGTVLGAGTVRRLACDAGPFPGCTVPSTWTDAHHLLHWLDRGRSDLDDAALLCGRHHRTAHDRKLWGEVVAGRVVWDLQPGSYDRECAGRPRPRSDPGDDDDGGGHTLEHDR